MHLNMLVVVHSNQHFYDQNLTTAYWKCVGDHRTDRLMIFSEFHDWVLFISYKIV